MKKIIFVVLLVGCCSLFADAQATAAAAADEEDFQSWNDLQLTVAMSKKVDFFTQATMRFGKNARRAADGRFAIGYIWKPHKSWSFSPFYWHIRARNAAGRFRTEHRLNLRAIYRFPFKKFGLQHRSWFEYRLRRPLNSWRYRPSLSFEKDIPEKIVRGAKFFVTEEIFYDSLLKKFSRNRVTVGVTKTLTKKLSLDVYYMRQNDGFSRPGDLNVVGTAWKVRW
jgi:hypothetical protein